MRKYLFKRDTILATIMVFVVMGLLSLIPLNTHVLDPIKLALFDFDYNDLAYSKMGKNNATPIDTNIVIVNIGSAKRHEIAALMAKIKGQSPAVIGVDVTFDRQKTLADDSLLITLANDSAFVMAYKLKQVNKDLWPEGFLYETYAAKGFANFVGEEGGVIRSMSPVVKMDKNVYQSFAASIVQKVDKNAYSRLLQRNNKTEAINYMLPPQQFIIVQGTDILQETDSLPLYNKIVLLGYIGSNEHDIEDKLFTPANVKSSGKSLPDMHGVLIHANIIYMMLHDKYIRQMPLWLTSIIAFLLCWLHMSIFLSFYVERHLWFHLAAKVAQIVSAIFFIYLGLLIFYKLDYKINLTSSFVAIILAVDVLYFYESICNWLHKKYGLQSVFTQHKH